MDRRTLKIGIVARGLRQGGVKRFIDNVLEQIERIDEMGGRELAPVLFTDSQEFRDRFRRIRVVRVPGSVVSFELGKLPWDYVGIVPYLLRERVEAMIYPKYIIPFTHTSLRFRKINIVHDLGHFRSDMYAYPLAEMLYVRSLLPRSCRTATRVVAVSEFTKRDIVETLGVDPRKVDVCLEGVDGRFRREEDRPAVEAVQKRLGVREPFLFYCGAVTPRKNVLRMLQAFDRVKHEIPHRLYLAVNFTMRDREVAELLRTRLEGRAQIIGILDDPDLAALYTSADAALYPSIHEGFGLPILEAQACGCPVLTSNVTSCPEVAGDSACLVDPFSVEDIAAGIRRIVQDPAYRAGLVAKGLENIRRFDWNRTARRILEAAMS